MSAMVLERAIGPLDFGSDFDPCLPETYVSPAKQMRLGLEAQIKERKRRERQVRQLRKSAKLLLPRIQEEQRKIEGSNQSYTITRSMEVEDDLRLLQSALLVIAEGVEKNTLPEYLQALDSKGVIETVVTSSYPGSGKEREKRVAALAACGIATAEEVMNTQAALLPYLWKRTPEEQYARDVQKSLQLCKQKMPHEEYETPTRVAGRMVIAAEIRKGQSVLEPSAGFGTLADLIRDWETDITLHLVEKVADFRTHLELCNHDVIPVDDFLTAEFSVTYDRIVMSPPWERGQDMEHVMKAASLLNPGGRLVALVSQQSFERKDHKGKHYRQWIKENYGTTTVTVLSTSEFSKMSGTSGILLIHNRKEVK